MNTHTQDTFSTTVSIETTLFAASNKRNLAAKFKSLTVRVKPRYTELIRRQFKKNKIK